jgi:hypothetical protein
VGFTPRYIGSSARARERLKGQDAADKQVSADGGPYDESLILAEGLDAEPPHRLEAYVKQEHVAAFHTLAEAAGDAG